MSFQDQASRDIYTLLFVSEMRKQREYPNAKGYVVELYGPDGTMTVVEPHSKLEKTLLNVLGRVSFPDLRVTGYVSTAMERLQMRESVLWAPFYGKGMGRRPIYSFERQKAFEDMEFFKPTLRP